MQETKKYFLILTLITALVVFFPSLPQPRPKVQGAFEESAYSLPLAEDRSVPLPEAREDVAVLQLVASAAFVKDLSSGIVLFDKQSGKKLPVASLTKLMTALVAEERLGPEESVKIMAEDLKVPQARAGLVAGEEVSARDLLAAMLIGSANDAALALARATEGSIADFVAAMNKKAVELGMRDTTFRNPVGLDEAGHLSTARDLGMLVEEFLRHPQLVQMSGKKSHTIISLDGKRSHHIVTTNRLLQKDGVVGLKTGYTTEAKGNLILLLEEPAIYTIVLGSDKREEESESVLKWIRENFLWPSSTTSIGREAAKNNYQGNRDY